MPSISIEVEDWNQEAQGLLIPQAITTPYQEFAGLKIASDGQQRVVRETTSEQAAIWLSGASQGLEITYAFTDSGVAMPPNRFVSFDNRYTRASLDMHQIIENLVDNNQAQTVQNIVTHTAGLFEYGHVDQRFNDGHDEVPVIACGTAKGSCIDINTYLISALRVADIPTVYFAGYFFPEERGGVTNDMHCWVSTWVDGAWLEWDIAHHMKLGLGPDEVRPGYNPKPGRRYALTYGRGLTFNLDGMELALSHLSEPMWVHSDGSAQKAKIIARLSD